MSFLTVLKSAGQGIVKTARGVAKSGFVKQLGQSAKQLANDPAKAKGLLDSVLGFGDFFKSSKDATDNFNKLSNNELLNDSIPWYKKTLFKVVAFGSLGLLIVWGVIRFVTNPKKRYSSSKSRF